MEGIRDAGYQTPTAIQEQAIPIIMEGKDLIGSAQTGTGKTAAFVLPVMHRLLSNPKPGIRCLILSPTRELATQIYDQIWGLGYHTGLSSANIIGGTDWVDQSEALKRGANLVVATPGRLMDQMRDIAIDFSSVEILILDEADRMLDMGFMPAVMNILSKLPAERQNLLFSATIPGKIKSITENMMKDPIWVNVASYRAADTVTQRYYLVPEFQKPDLLAKLIKKHEWKSVIVFTGTKKGADHLTGKLQRRDIPVSSIHGDRSQEEREIALNAFKSGQYQVLVATDVIARGIDITDVSHIVNFDIPRDLDDYIHRIGRTGRNEATGEAVTLVSQGELKYLDTLRDRLKIEILREEIPEDIQEFLDQKAKNIDHRRDPKKLRHGQRPHRGDRPHHSPDAAEAGVGTVSAGADLVDAVGEASTPAEGEEAIKRKKSNRNRRRPKKRPQGDGQAVGSEAQSTVREGQESAEQPRQEGRQQPRREPRQDNRPPREPRGDNRNEPRQDNRPDNRQREPRTDNRQREPRSDNRNENRPDNRQQRQDTRGPRQQGQGPRDRKPGQQQKPRPQGQSRVSQAGRKPESKNDGLKLSQPGSLLTKIVRFFTGKK